MEDGPAEQAHWSQVRAALENGDLDEAARLVLKTTLMPGMQRQLKAKYTRVPLAYVEDAIAEAVSETFVRLQRGHDIGVDKIGGYIYNTAHHILARITDELKQKHQLIDPERTPYDEMMVERLGGLGEVSEDPTTRLRALELLASLIDALPSSDSAKQVMKVRFDGAVHGDWLKDGEVAEIIGKQKSSISSWWRRGLADLHQHCLEHGITRDGLEQLAEEFDRMEADVEDQDEQEEYDDDDS